MISHEGDWVGSNNIYNSPVNVLVSGLLLKTTLKDYYWKQFCGNGKVTVSPQCWHAITSSSSNKLSFFLPDKIAPNNHQNRNGSSSIFKNLKCIFHPFNYHVEDGGACALASIHVFQQLQQRTKKCHSIEISIASKVPSCASVFVCVRACVRTNDCWIIPMHICCICLVKS